MAGYKLNLKKPVTLLNTNDNWAEQEIRETPFPVVMNNIKYFGATLPKQEKDLYGKSFDSLKKLRKISEDAHGGLTQ